LTGFSTDCDFRAHKRKSESDCENQINKQKNTAAVFCSEIRETPDIAQADGRASGCEDEAYLPCEATSFIFHLILLIYKYIGYSITKIPFSQHKKRNRHVSASRRFLSTKGTERIKGIFRHNPNRSIGTSDYPF
jgi:hypothetical protein